MKTYFHMRTLNKLESVSVKWSYMRFSTSFLLTFDMLASLYRIRNYKRLLRSQLFVALNTINVLSSRGADCLFFPFNHTRNHCMVIKTFTQLKNRSVHDSVLTHTITIVKF